MIQTDILNRLLPDFKSKPSNTAVLVMGSVANQTALPNSDLNLLILGQENKYKTETIDGILVEYIYVTFEEALHRLNTVNTEVYHYLGSKIMYDLDGRMLNLMMTALNKYKNFKTNPNDKKEIHQWLHSTGIKLRAALHNNDMLKTIFITSTASWKIIEAVWAVNDKPIPPMNRVILELPNLKRVPDPKWFEGLFCELTELRAKNMLAIIGWVLPLLEQQ